MVLVAIDLVEGFFDFDARTFEFYLYQRQTIDQKRHIITVLVTSFQTDLIGDLK
jgi:hypothetical protein